MLIAPEQIKGQLLIARLKRERRNWIKANLQAGRPAIAKALGISEAALSIIISKDLVNPVVLDGLRQGLGCEDIAVRNGILSRDVRADVQKLRDDDELAKIYRKPGI